MPCEKGSSMVRRFSIPPLHRQWLSSPHILWPPATSFSIPITGTPVWGGEEGRCRRRGGGCDYLGVKDRMWATKREFFKPTSSQSRICGWTGMEFKQWHQTKHTYREILAGFTRVYISQTETEVANKLLLSKLEKLEKKENTKLVGREKYK